MYLYSVLLSVDNLSVVSFVVFPRFSTKSNFISAFGNTHQRRINSLLILDLVRLWALRTSLPRPQVDSLRQNLRLCRQLLSLRFLSLPRHLFLRVL